MKQLFDGDYDIKRLITGLQIESGVTISAYKDNAFKLFMLDVGLLAAKSGLDVKLLLEGNRVFEEFKGKESPFL